MIDEDGDTPAILALAGVALAGLVLYYGSTAIMAYVNTPGFQRSWSKLCAGMAGLLASLNNAINSWQSQQAAKKAAQTAAKAAKELQKTAGKYGRLKCKEAADAMAKALKKLKLHGSIIQLYFPNAYKGYVCSKRTGDSLAISENGRHYGVLYEGKVYCNIYPEGIAKAQWINNFYDAWDSKPIVTEIKF